MPVGLRGHGRAGGGYAIRAAEYFDKRAHVSRGVVYVEVLTLVRLSHVYVNRGEKDRAHR